MAKTNDIICKRHLRPIAIKCVNACEIKTHEIARIENEQASEYFPL